MTDAGAAIGKEDFAAAMSAMAKLRPAVDAFFDKVTVNADDKALRENRLQAAQPDPRGDARGGGLLEDRGVICPDGVRDTIGNEALIHFRRMSRRPTREHAT